ASSSSVLARRPHGSPLFPYTTLFRSQRAGAKVLDQDVGLGHQLADNGLAFGGLEVQRHRALVARLHVPPQRGAVLELAPLAQRVADLRRLDLDHLGAEFAEQLAGEGAGDQLAHLDHLEALQRQALLCLLAHRNTCAGWFMAQSMTDAREADN